MHAGFDIRFAFRTMRRRRAYAALAVGTLALGTFRVVIYPDGKAGGTAKGKSKKK